MKKWLPLLLFFTYSRVFSQNEFAAEAFYNDFEKIHSDAQKGFLKYKGNKIKGGYNDMAEEYSIKLLLPLADSGRIVFPATGKPYAEFFFQTARTKKQIDQRAVNLREAILTIYKRPLSIRTETSGIKQTFFSNTYFFDQHNESLAIFKSRIYQFKRRFYLTLIMLGNKE